MKKVSNVSKRSTKMNVPIDTIEIIIEFLIYIPLFTLVILMYLLLNKVQKYRNEVEYLKSVCEQAVKINEQTEKKLNEHISKQKFYSTKSYFQGYTKGKKNVLQPNNTRRERN